MFYQFFNLKLYVFDVVLNQLFHPYLEDKFYRNQLCKIMSVGFV